jgi:hypothetical protein
MPYDNIGQFLKEEALLASEQVFVAVNVQDRGVARFSHVQPDFAVRMVAAARPLIGPVRVLPWEECTPTQQRQASHKPIWGMVYARELVQKDHIPMPAAPPVKKDAPVTVGQILHNRFYQASDGVWKPAVKPIPKLIPQPVRRPMPEPPQLPLAARQLQDHFDQAVNAIPKVRSASAGGGL